MGLGTSSHRHYGGRWASIADDIRALEMVYLDLKRFRQRGFYGALPLVEDAIRIVQRLRDAPLGKEEPVIELQRLDSTLRLLDAARTHTGREDAYYWHNTALESLYKLLKRKGSLAPYTPPLMDLKNETYRYPSEAVIYRLAALLAQGKLYYSEKDTDIVDSLKTLVTNRHAHPSIRNYAEATLEYIKRNPADIKVEKMVSTLLTLLDATHRMDD